MSCQRYLLRLPVWFVAVCMVVDSLLMQAGIVACDVTCYVELLSWRIATRVWYFTCIVSMCLRCFWLEG